MTKRDQEFIKNFFEGVLLEGLPITDIHVLENPQGEGVGVFLYTRASHLYHTSLHFPEKWERPTLMSQEEWQRYMEASQEGDNERDAPMGVWDPTHQHLIQAIRGPDGS